MNTGKDTKSTESNFYTATVNTVDPSSKLKAMYYKSFSSSSSSHGQQFEGHVRVLYEKLVRDIGISVASYPYIALLWMALSFRTIKPGALR